MDQQIENEHLHQQLESTLIAYADKQDAAAAAAAADDAHNRIWRRFLQLDSHVMLKSASSIFIKVMGEMIGSFFLLFFLSAISMGDYLDNGRMDLVQHGLMAGFAIMVIIFSIGHISGSHVNPAVTVAFAAIAKFPWIQVPFYVLGQLIGGLLGALAARHIYDVSLELVLTTPQSTIAKCFAAEFIAAMQFMMLACSVSTDGHVAGLNAAIAITVAIALDIVIIWPISGASMNPIRSLVPAILTSTYKDVWIYVVAPPLGTIFGAWIHKSLDMAQTHINAGIVNRADPPT